MNRDLLVFWCLAISFLTNVYLFARLTRMRRANVTRHSHKWTPWSDWRVLEGHYSRTTVAFLRVRYCEFCALEQKQEVGKHYCDDLMSVISNSHCSHQELYTGIFDPMYELKQINKDLEELQ